MKRLLAVVALLLAIGTAPAAAQSRESEIIAVRTQATVNPDGSMDVVELLAYDFTDDRNGGFRTFVPDPANYRIVDFRVTEDGEPRDLAPGFTDPNTGNQVRWFGSGDRSKVNGRHDYELRYTVEGAVDVHADIAELNWQFLGVDFPQVDEVSVDVTFPPGAGELRAFAHGALSGVVGIDGDTVSARVVDNPEGVIVELRILADTARFDVAPGPAPALSRILAEEEVLAEAANRQRAELLAQFERTFARDVAEGVPDDCDGADGKLADLCGTLEELVERGETRVGEELTIEDAELLTELRAARDAVEDEIDRIFRGRVRSVVNPGGVVVAGAGAAAWFLTWRKWGKDPVRPEDIGEYWREVPPETPAVIATLDDVVGVDSKALVATLVDLAQRGWLTITEERDTHRFTRTTKAEGEPLKNYEASLLWRLFPPGRLTVTQDELTAEAKADRTLAAGWMNSFNNQVRADYDSHGYHARHGCLPWFIAAVLVVTLAVVAVVGFAFSAWVGGIVAAATALVLLVLTPLLRRRTEKGARKLAEVQALKRFLEDFSLVDDVPIGHLALYERYLVYAVALGVAHRLIAAIRVRFPQLASDPNFAPWYGYSHGHAAVGAALHGGGIDRLASLSRIDAFATDFSRATATAFSPPSSASGGGGGFSGGSSGGGGGGGAGSW